MVTALSFCVIFSGKTGKKIPLSRRYEQRFCFLGRIGGNDARKKSAKTWADFPFPHISYRITGILFLTTLSFALTSRILSAIIKYRIQIDIIGYEVRGNVDHKNCSNYRCIRFYRGTSPAGSGTQMPLHGTERTHLTDLSLIHI